MLRVDHSEIYLAVFRQNKKAVAGHLLLSLLIWSLYPVKFLYIAHLFAADYVGPSLVAITFIAYLATMIPLLPGGIGSFEATMSGLLILTGFPAMEATAAAVVFRFFTFGLVIIAGLVMSGMLALRDACPVRQRSDSAEFM